MAPAAAPAPPSSLSLSARGGGAEQRMTARAHDAYGGVARPTAGRGRRRRTQEIEATAVDGGDVREGRRRGGVERRRRRRGSVSVQQRFRRRKKNWRGRSRRELL